jgi:alpha-N-arabinofuranosidase
MMAMLATASSAIAQEAAPIAVSVDVSQASAPVSEEQFGMFIEHIGTLVYDSLWSEMLDDRKFFGPILDSEPEAAPASARSFRRELRQWVAVGGGQWVTLDGVEPYTGEHSPCIALDASQPRGIRQTGFSLVEGKALEGRIVLRASGEARVVVSLLRDGGVRESVVIEPTAGYEKYPLAFSAGAASANAALEITATGEGMLHIGAVSLMPADNVEGFRPDVIALLKDLDSGMWRLPGGNVISAWNWYDSIGDIDRRPPYFDPVWNALQSNDVGLDEYMTLCRLIGVEPYITVSAGFGDSHSAAEQVEYINGAATTHMGAQRAANGHPEPYGVRYWNIGNEPYGSWQFGRTDLCFYVHKHNEFARAMRKVDPSIVLLASGSMPDRLWKDPEVPVPYDTSKETIGTEWDWTGGLFAHCMDNFDGMTEHWYAPAGMKYDPANAPEGVDLMFAGYVKMDYTVLEWVRYPSNRVRVKAEQWDQYRRLFPQIDRQGKFLSIDEYAFMAWQPSLKTALAYGMVFNRCCATRTSCACRPSRWAPRPSTSPRTAPPTTPTALYSSSTATAGGDCP